MAKIYETVLDVKRDELQQAKDKLISSNKLIGFTSLFSGGVGLITLIDAIKTKGTFGKISTGFTGAFAALTVTAAGVYFKIKNNIKNIEQEQKTIGKEEIVYPASSMANKLSAQEIQTIEKQVNNPVSFTSRIDEETQQPQPELSK